MPIGIRSRDLLGMTFDSVIVDEYCTGGLERAELAAYAIRSTDRAICNLADSFTDYMAEARTGAWQEYERDYLDAFRYALWPYKRKEKVVPIPERPIFPTYQEGDLYVITGNSNDHKFEIGETVKVRTSGVCLGATVKMMHLDGRDWWNVRHTECRPVPTNSIRFKKKRQIFLKEFGIEFT